MPYRPRPSLSAAKPNFQALWNLLVGIAEKTNNTKFKAVLTNHSDRQEYICRRLGVISQADIDRYEKKLQRLNHITRL